MTALAVGLAVFALAAAAISVLTRRLLDPASHGLSTVRGFTAAALLGSLAAIALSKTGQRGSAAEWQAVFLLGFFGLLWVLLTLRCISVLPLTIRFNHVRCLQRLRQLLSRVAAWPSTITSPAAFAIALGVWVVLPFSLVGVARWGTGQHPGPLGLPADRLVADILVTGALVALVEEWFFRWPAVFAFRGDSLLLALTILWVVLHPVEELLLKGTPPAAVVWALPGWCLSAVFYYKVWRGPLFWTAFLVHSSGNVGVVFASNYLGAL